MSFTANILHFVCGYQSMQQAVLVIWTKTVTTEQNDICGMSSDSLYDQLSSV
jgi:hypothetical protein